MYIFNTVLRSMHGEQKCRSSPNFSAIDKTKWVIKVKLLCICDDNFLDFVVVVYSDGAATA